MKILLVSGFLGAGKTTFIKALSQNTHKDFAVLENEYGQAAIDGTVLSENGTVGNIDALTNENSDSEQNKKINIWEMTEGCICCSMKKDFSASILTLSNVIDPEYLVVEPTGVGKPGNILSNVKQILYDRISLLAPITIVDGNLFDRQISEFPDIYIDQIKTASKVLISKMENADPNDLQILENKIHEYNPSCKVITQHYSKLSPKDWMSFLKTSFDGQILSSTPEEDTDLETIGLTDVGCPTEVELIYFLERVIRYEFGNIVRAKGYLPVGKQWLKFDVTDGRYIITGIEEQKDSRCVFIGKSLDRSKIRKQMLFSLYKQSNLSKLTSIPTKPIAE